MFERFRGGSLVGEGTYLNLKEGEFVAIPSDGDYLGGAADQTFIKVPLAVVLLLAPFLGLAFILFLPMAVPLVMGMLVIQRLKRRVPELRDSALKVTTFSQQPGMSYLQMKGRSGRAKQPKDVDGRPTEVISGSLDEVINRLEEDIARKREAEEK